MSAAQRKMLYAKMKEAGLNNDECKDLFAFVGVSSSKTASAFIEGFDKAVSDWRMATGAKTPDLPDEAKEEGIPW